MGLNHVADGQGGRDGVAVKVQVNACGGVLDVNVSAVQEGYDTLDCGVFVKSQGSCLCNGDDRRPALFDKGGVDGNIGCRHDELFAFLDVNRRFDTCIAVGQCGQLIVVGRSCCNGNRGAFCGLLCRFGGHGAVGNALSDVDGIISRCWRSGNLTGFVQVNVELTISVAGEQPSASVES